MHLSTLHCVTFHFLAFLSTHTQKGENETIRYHKNVYTNIILQSISNKTFNHLIIFSTVILCVHRGPLFNLMPLSRAAACGVHPTSSDFITSRPPNETSSLMSFFRSPRQNCVDTSMVPPSRKIDSFNELHGTGDEISVSPRMVVRPTKNRNPPLKIVLPYCDLLISSSLK